MKLLVTGPLGHIGSSLIRFLPGAFPGLHVVLVDDFTTQRYSSLFDLPSDGTFEFHELDVALADIEPLLRNCDAVIHLAALTDATASVKNPDLYQRNLNATKNVAAACAKARCAMMFVSSTSVYGTQKSSVDESCTDEDLKPQSPYARSKIEEEKYLQAFANGSGLSYIICRFGTICGTSPGMRFHTAVNKFCFQAIMGQPITVWKTAYDQYRPYLELGDACRGIAHILKKGLFDGEIYNLVTKNTTVREIVDAIRIHVPSVAIAFTESQIMNQLSYNVSATKFEKTGFVFSGSISEAIANTVALLKNANKQQ